VVLQPGFDDRRYGGINPYALGFAMCCDIERVCTQPTDEDREWMPDIAGNNDAYGTLREIWANYRDESFVSQFLSPRVIRDFGLFRVVDDEREEEMNVAAIHDERGYRNIRRALSKHYDIAYRDPDIQILDVDLEGDRKLILGHRVLDGIVLEENDAQKVLQHVAELWGYDVKLVEQDDNGVIRAEHAASPRRPFV
jgi:spore cortex formation protein SpoVR/YcgB (stage V sporulation)